MQISISPDSMIAFIAAGIALVSLLVSMRQAKLFPNPVIGIRITSIHISNKHSIGPGKRDYRQGMSVEVELSNLGSGPAVGLIGDAAVLFANAVEAMPTVIPQRFDPEYQAYLRTAESSTMSFAFGNLAVDAVIADLRTTEEKNLRRIRDEPSRAPYEGPQFEILIFYTSNLGVHYQSHFSAYFSVREHMNGFIGMPERDENLQLTMHYIPRPVFTTQVIRRRKMEAILARNGSKRKLSGW